MDRNHAELAYPLSALARRLRPCAAMPGSAEKKQGIDNFEENAQQAQSCKSTVLQHFIFRSIETSSSSSNACSPNSAAGWMVK